MDLKIASFNIEWMVSVFNGRWTDWSPDVGIPDTFAGRQLGSITLEPIQDVRKLCERIAGTIEQMDAQIIGLQEGPPLKSQMEFFVDQFLNGEYTVFTSNSRWQTIHALVHQSIAEQVTAKDSSSDEVKVLWKDIGFYPWGEIAEEFRLAHSFHRRPLMLTYAPSDDASLEILVVHTKSKFSSLDLEGWLERDPEAMHDALLARQKLSAEIRRLRKYIEGRIKDESTSLIVMGDLNDGPLAEEFEEEFMIHNILDELVGSIMRPELVMKHAMTPAQISEAWTAEFSDPLKGNELTRELIDHIIVSPALINGNGAFGLSTGSGKIEHAVFNANSDGPGRDERPSDHRPISVSLQIP